jgi:hypothetical protein
MTQSRVEYKEALNAAVADAEVQSFRESTSKLVAESLCAAGKVLWVSSWMLRDKNAEGVALVAQMGGELARAIGLVLEKANWYSGASMIRQLIEAEYLMWTFSDAPEAAQEWLSASAENLRQTWNPAAMRKRSRGKFRDREYWTHCDIGGHPTPKARYLLPEHSWEVDPRYLWVDFVHHLAALWRDTDKCLKSTGFANISSEESWMNAGASLAAWQEREPAILLELPSDFPAT